MAEYLSSNGSVEPWSVRAFRDIVGWHLFREWSIEFQVSEAWKPSEAVKMIDWLADVN